MDACGLGGFPSHPWLFIADDLHTQLIPDRDSAAAELGILGTRDQSLACDPGRAAPRLNNLTFQ